jgi:hypothetical protein
MFEALRRLEIRTPVVACPSWFVCTWSTVALAMSAGT